MSKTGRDERPAEEWMGRGGMSGGQDEQRGETSGWTDGGHGGTRDESLKQAPST